MANTFKSYQNSAVTTETTIFTGPANTASTIIGMSIANSHTSAVSVSVKLNSTYIIKDAPVGTGSSLIVVGAEQKIVVESGDTVKVTSSGSADVIMSTLEIS